MWGQEGVSWGSEYILKRILRLQARLLVSCFSRLGLDLPLKPADTPTGECTGVQVRRTTHGSSMQEQELVVTGLPP